MSSTPARIGTAIFAVAPVTATVVVPWILTRFRPHRPVSGGRTAQVVGAAMIAAGVPTVADGFRRFAVEGRGTPFPGAPTEELVVTGAYRHVRNPMYVAMLSMIVGEGLLLGQRRLFGYAAVMSVPVVAFVRLYEEPTLAVTFGPRYEDYRRMVPGWIPRLTPAAWEGTE